MKKILIKNATVIYPSSIANGKNVLIENGKIADVDYIREIEENCEIIDACGGYLFAGFVDLHVHGGGGADFMDATSNAFETVVKTHLSHGTTTIVPTAMSATQQELKEFLYAYKDFKKQSEYADLTVGVHLEGPYFSGANAKSSGAQPSDVLRYPDVDEINQLINIANGDIIRWDAAPELPGADMFAKIMTENNILCAVAHSDATAEQTMFGFKNGFSHITHFYNAVSSHRKRKQKVYAGIVEATYLDDSITIELIGDGCHIAKEDFMLALKIKGAENISVITDAMRLAGTEMKSGKLGSLKNGTDCIVDDGVAKLCDLSSFAGSVCTMDRALSVLCKDFGFSPKLVSVMMSYAPAKLLGLENIIGSIGIGKKADLVITDEEYNVKAVIKNGKIF